MPLHPKPAQADVPATKLMNLLGALAASIFAVAIPLVYILFSLYSLQQSHAAEADFLAKSIERIVQARPDLWEFESVRLQEIISQPSFQGHPAEREIRAAAGRLVTKTDYTDARPAIAAAAIFFDSGRPAGSVIVRYSVRTQIIVTAFLGMLSFPLAYLLYFLFRTYPLRKLKNTLEALQASNELLSQYMRHSPIYTYIKEVTPRQSIVLQASDNFHELIGMPGYDMTGKTMAELFPREFAAKMTADDWAVVSRGDVLRLDEEFNGRSYTTIKFPIVQGNKTLLAGYTIDVTDRKQGEEEKRTLEERLHRAEKMEALGTLAGGVAHDLNNVLGVLMGYSELLIEKIPASSPLRIYVDKILKSAEKGASIIQDLLTLARRGVSVSQPINLNHIISTFLKSPVFEKLQAYHPRVTFRTELDRGLLNIKGSPVHLEKTLMNLLSNALEAIAESGEVTIRTENRYLASALRGYDQVQAGEYVVLTVSDNGSGIHPDDLGKIFEPFYTKKVMGRSGTGLGLAIIWGTVKDHYGYIDVQSVYGKGSTFTLYFPITREEVPDGLKKIPIEQYQGKGESILVVDDVEEQRTMAAMMLTKLGYEVQTVAGGEEAAEYLKTHNVDLLVLDMIMGSGIDGLETYRRVREISLQQKAILVSGFSETERVKQAQELGAGAYVKKPYLLETIGLAVRKELDRSA